MPDPLHFPPNVPLVGQPLHVLGYTVIALAACGCGQGQPMQLIAQLAADGMHRTKGECGWCHQAYAIQQVTVDAKGNLLFGIELLTPQPAA